jgi:hypothetical protein
MLSVLWCLKHICMHTFPFMNYFVIDMSLWCHILCVDCAECNECLCESAPTLLLTKASVTMFPCPTESFGLVAFLVEDACIGVLLISYL